MKEHLILEELEEHIIGGGGGGAWSRGEWKGVFKSQVSYTRMFIFSNMKHCIL